MQTLIFSDTHLTHNFDKDLYDYIVKLVKNADQVIINGDFWDAYLTTFNSFCKSKWKKLFPLLKKKKTVYVVGNHDKLSSMDDRVFLFADCVVDDYEFSSGDRSFYVTHGHYITPTYDSIFLFRNPTYTRFLYRIFVYLTQKVSFIKRIFKKIERNKNLKHLDVIKEYTKMNNKKKQFFIFGHSHIIDLKISEHFISLGKLQSSEKTYCLIEDGHIDLITEEKR